MKKLLLFYCCLISTLAAAQQINEPFNFPVKPGTKEWSNLRTEQERFNAMQIPEDLLKSITTSALVISCINYPAFGYITAYSNIQTGFVFLTTKFNGLDELTKRSDTEECLISIYKITETNGFKDNYLNLDDHFWTIKFSWIELLLAQNKFIESLSPERKKDLLLLTIEKYNLKRSSSDYSASSLVSTTFLAARVLHSLNDEKFELEYVKNEPLSVFINTSIISEKNIINYVFEFATNYLKENL